MIISQVCTLCSGSNCHECTAADVCTMCDNQYSLLNGACLSSCPASYQSNGTHCNDINNTIKNNNNHHGNNNTKNNRNGNNKK